MELSNSRLHSQFVSGLHLEVIFHFPLTLHMQYISLSMWHRIISNLLSVFFNINKLDYLTKLCVHVCVFEVRPWYGNHLFGSSNASKWAFYFCVCCLSRPFVITVYFCGHLHISIRIVYPKLLSKYTVREKSTKTTR